MQYNTLSHHGIRGQKWGVRRFQNKDGTLTAKGKSRYSKYLSDEEIEYGRKEDNTEYKYNKPGESGWIGMGRAIKAKVLSNKENKKKISEMTDDELRNSLNRLRMEDEYNRLSSKSINRGQKAVKKAIASLSTAAAVSSSIVTISKNAGRIEKILTKK